jgi:hypothetical protein
VDSDLKFSTFPLLIAPLQPIKASNEEDPDPLYEVVRGSRAAFWCYHRAQPAGQFFPSFDSTGPRHYTCQSGPCVQLRGRPAQTMIRLSNLHNPRGFGL